MRRLVLLIALVAGLAVPALSPSTASAACAAPEGQTTAKVRSAKLAYEPTNIESDWVYQSHGGYLTYPGGGTGRLNVATSARPSDTAAALRAAGTSLRHELRAGWSNTIASHTEAVPSDGAHRYRLHLYRYAASFSVRAYAWSTSTCRYSRPVGSGWKRIEHAPTSDADTVWFLDSQTTSANEGRDTGTTPIVSKPSL